MGIFKEQLDIEVQASLEAADSGVGGPVEARAVDSAIAAADAGKTLYVADAGTVTLTFDAGLPEGFEITVVAGVAASVTVQPASGQQMSSHSGTLLGVDIPVGSSEPSGAGSTIVSTDNWKLVGTRWLTMAGYGWGAIIPPVVPDNWYIAQLDHQYLNAEQIDLDPAGVTTQSNVQLRDIQAEIIDLRDGIYRVSLDGAVLIDFDQTVPTTPYTDPTSGIVITDFNMLPDPGAQQGHFSMDWSTANNPSSVFLVVQNLNLDTILNNNVAVATPTLPPASWEEDSGGYIYGNGQSIAHDVGHGPVPMLLKDSGGGVVDWTLTNYTLRFGGQNLIESGDVAVQTPYTDPATGIVFDNFNLGVATSHFTWNWATANASSNADLEVQDTGLGPILMTNTTMVSAAFSNLFAAEIPGGLLDGVGLVSWDINGDTEWPPLGNMTPRTAMLASFWFYNTRVPTGTVEPVIMNQWRDDGGVGAAPVWAVDLYDSGGQKRLRTRFTDGSSDWIYSIDFTTWSASTQWHHALVVFDVGSHGAPLTAPRIYIDGILRTIQNDAPSSTPANLDLGSIPLDIGYRLTNEEPPVWVGDLQQYSGRQDEIALWSTRPTTPDGNVTLAAGYDAFAGFLYNAGSPIDFLDGTIWPAGDSPNEAWRFETTPPPVDGSPIGASDNGLPGVIGGVVKLHPSPLTGAAPPVYRAGPVVI